MNSKSIIEMNKVFDKLNNEISIEYILEPEIDRYIKLKKELNELENQINLAANPHGLYFNTNSCLLANINKSKLFIKKVFKINKNEIIDIDTITEISQETYDYIKKYLKNDKEKIVQFLNLRNLSDFNELSDIRKYISYFFCGICSENNIIEINENYNDNDCFVIYNVKLHQIENKVENIYGEISIILK